MKGAWEQDEFKGSCWFEKILNCEINGKILSLMTHYIIEMLTNYVKLLTISRTPGLIYSGIGRKWTLSEWTLIDRMKKVLVNNCQMWSTELLPFFSLFLLFFRLSSSYSVVNPSHSSFLLFCFSFVCFRSYSLLMAILGILYCKQPEFFFLFSSGFVLAICIWSQFISLILWRLILPRTGFIRHSCIGVILISLAQYIVCNIWTPIFSVFLYVLSSVFHGDLFEYCVAV